MESNYFLYKNPRRRGKRSLSFYIWDSKCSGKINLLFLTWKWIYFLNINFRYAETYCFASGSYFLTSDEEIDMNYPQRENRQITYYQWVPLVLAFQAIFFYIPSFIWKALNFNTGSLFIFRI